MKSILVKNETFCLTLSPDCVATSLIYLPTGEECIAKGEEMPLFSVTENRPFNNEIKLAHPNKKTVFSANRVRREGNNLIVGFELVHFEAVVEIKEEKGYIAFKLADFIVSPEAFSGLSMDVPPVVEFRLLQLPLKKRERFGAWLNVLWNDSLAVNVLSTSPYARIDSDERKNCHILYADAVKDIKLYGTEAALIVCPPDKLLDNIEAIENDYNLPKGVAARRRDSINRSVYWSAFVNPKNVDEHIAYARAGGFTMMLLYYTCFCELKGGLYSTSGDYSFNDDYPNKEKDLKAMLDKIKAAGITPGIHFLHTHIGNGTRYVTPVADHRLGIKRYLTLARPVLNGDTELYVEENPEGCEMNEKCRVLKFGGELIHYESYTTEPPYKFTGIERGYWNTNVTGHDMGTIGGILDISEYGATSVYINQNTSLQDEIADSIANVYNLGFEFIYFDGSEGTNPPYEFHVPNAQYRVYKKLKKEPLFCEGAAKAHFGWHILSGGNAFDIWKDENFKECIVKYQMEEAERIASDFTRINFGWWAFRETTGPDLYEFGLSRSVAYDCPITIQAYPEILQKNPRLKDILEVFKRWEDVRIKKLLTKEQKEELKNPDIEHILLINEEGAPELTPYSEIKDVCKKSEDIKAYSFERKGKSYIVFWHTKSEGTLCLNEVPENMTVENEIGANNVACTISGGKALIPFSNRTYLSSTMEKSKLKALFLNGEVL